MVGRYFFGQVMSPKPSDQMLQRSQVSGVALWMSKVKEPWVTLWCASEYMWSGLRLRAQVVQYDKLAKAEKRFALKLFWICLHHASPPNIQQTWMLTHRFHKTLQTSWRIQKYNSGYIGYFFPFFKRASGKVFSDFNLVRPGEKPPPLSVKLTKSKNFLIKF